MLVLKQMQKASLARRGVVQHALSERRVAALVQHPCLAKLVSTYQDASSVSLLFEAYLGGELHALLAERECLASTEASFYLAQV